MERVFMRINKFKNFYKKYGFYVLIAYLILSYFLLPLGLVAIICMVSPIIFAFMGKGRYWCGNFCPRGIFFKMSPVVFHAENPSLNF